MKKRIPLTLLYTILCSLLASSLMVNQITAQSMSSQNRYTKTTTASDTRKQVSTYRKASKKLSARHHGYVIEIASANYPLDDSQEIFKQFGNVFYDKLPGGGYSYCIKVDFSSLDAIRNYLNNNIIYRVPEARIIQYKKGKRSLVD